MNFEMLMEAFEVVNTLDGNDPSNYEMIDNAADYINEAYELYLDYCMMEGYEPLGIEDYAYAMISMDEGFTDLLRKGIQSGANREASGKRFFGTNKVEFNRDPSSAYTGRYLHGYHNGKRVTYPEKDMNKRLTPAAQGSVITRQNGKLNKIDYFGNIGKYAAAVHGGAENLGKMTNKKFWSNELAATKRDMAKLGNKAKGFASGFANKFKNPNPNSREGLLARQKAQKAIARKNAFLEGYNEYFDIIDMMYNNY